MPSTTSSVIFLSRQTIDAAGPDAEDRLASDLPFLDGHTQVQPELQEEFVEHVLLGAVWLDVLDGVKHRLLSVSQKSASQGLMLLLSNLKTLKPSPLLSG